MTTGQKVAFGVAVLSFLAAGGSATDLALLFGSTVAKLVAAAASLGAGVGGIYLGFVTGQTSQIAAVQAMPGVEKIVVNAKANDALATMAVDPVNAKIEASAAAAPTVIATAKAANS